MNFDFNNGNFDEILYDSNPKLINTVSELRHYINIYGITDKLLKYFNTDFCTIEDIQTDCYGNLSVSKLINDNEYLKDQITEREYINNKKEKAHHKNIELIEILKNKRKNFCVVGTNKIKRRLNKLAETDYIAKCYRLAIEIEDKNIQAKDNPYYSDKIYKEKYKYILELITIFKEHCLVYGKQISDVSKMSHIIYFEIPNCEQISFHTNLENEYNIPTYDKEWDGQINSTLNKLEKGILKTFNNIV